MKKARAPLAWLAVEARAARRRLAGALWGMHDEPTARRNLRRDLHRLRAAGLGDAIIAGDEAGQASSQVTARGGAGL